MTAIRERWSSYVLHEGEGVSRFWSKRFADAERNVLFIVGRGFDPRMCFAAETLLSLGGRGRREALLLDFDEGPDSPSQAYSSRVAENEARLETLFEKDTLRRSTIAMLSPDRRRISSRSAALIFRKEDDVAPYTDVIVDISALPRSIYFPVVAKLLFLIDGLAAKGQIVNLHVIVAEDPSLDQRIADVGIDDAAEYVHHFRGGVDLESTATHARLWIPLLGEGQGPKLERINDLVRPDEICPVLPFPSVNPRRADDLILEYHRLLFDEFRVEPRNFVYASESNPFQVYRHIRRAILQYVDALEPLGGCKVVLSSLTSKVLSIGALLVAYELKEAKMNVGIAQVEVQGYEILEPAPAAVPPSTRLFDIWIAGDCYARSAQPV